MATSAQADSRGHFRSGSGSTLNMLSTIQAMITKTRSTSSTKAADTTIAASPMRSAFSGDGDLVRGDVAVDPSAPMPQRLRQLKLLDE